MGGQTKFGTLNLAKMHTVVAPNTLSKRMWNNQILEIFFELRKIAKKKHQCGLEHRKIGTFSGHLKNEMAGYKVTNDLTKVFKDCHVFSHISDGWIESKQIGCFVGNAFYSVLGFFDSQQHNEPISVISVTLPFSLMILKKIYDFASLLASCLLNYQEGLGSPFSIHES